MEENKKLVEEQELSLDEKLIKTNELNYEINRLTKEKEELEVKLKEAEAQKQVYLDAILTEFKAKGIKESNVENEIFATLFSKEDIAWLDDEGLLKKLQENKANQFIKVVTKTTTSIDKNALKKAFKEDDALKEQYKDFYGKKLIEYVVVNNGEVHERMVEHIEDSIKKKK